ncbi:hypothetical protein BJ322DRAFT_1114899 [Thelephora terrestris]|uniref:Uncharacterized protein n=1 Tax=Thelephora terrestris TaxID=56493 RepID=A0A9P6H2L3_9AGAM|nr:hypothetical protein BJ322DRAFT_1114899 [Thelephora terrestris]
MSSSSKWTPPPAASDPIILEALVQIAPEAGVPTEEEHADWSRQSIRALVSARGGPEAFGPIWSTVLPIWRLNALQGRLEKEKELRGPWQVHAQAWMVRHRDVCRSFGLPPLQVIVDWADEMEIAGWLIPGPVPVPDVAEVTPAPATSHQPSIQSLRSANETFSPAASRQPPIRSLGDENAAPTPSVSCQPSTRPTPQTSERDEDVAMAETPKRGVGTSQSTTSERRGGVPYVDLSQQPPAPKKARDLVMSNVGAKRDLPASPSKEESISKRSRTTGRAGKEKEGPEDVVPAFPPMDLAGEVYEEGTPLNLTDFPGARSMACDWCRGKPRIGKACRPAWHPALRSTDTRVYLICDTCVVQKKGCSFRDMDFGITHWPIVECSEEGDNRRQKEANRKVKASTDEPVGEEGNVSKPKKAPRVRKTAASAAPDPSSSISTRSKTKAATLGSSTAVPTFAMAGLSVGGPSGVSSGLHSWEVDLRDFEWEWGTSQDSPVAIEQLRAALRSQIARERHEVDLIADLVASRRDIAKGILARMNHEIIARDGQPVWDSSDFVETSDDGDGDGDGDVSVGAVGDGNMFLDGEDVAGAAGGGSQGVGESGVAEERLRDV